MTTRPHTHKMTNIQLESLESREAPTVGISGAWQTALAQLQNRTAHVVGFQGVLRTLHLARPGTAHQGPAAVSMGGASNANTAADRVAANAPLALAQAHRVATRAAATAASSRAWMTAAVLRTAPATPVVTPTNPTTPTTPMTPPNQTNDAGTPQTLPPNVSGVLNVVYQNYITNSNQPIETGPLSVQIDGSNVGVNINGNGQGEFSTLVSTLQNLGMQITSTNDVTWTVSGMLPISQLPAAAQTPQTLSIMPRYSPLTS